MPLRWLTLPFVVASLSSCTEPSTHDADRRAKESSQDTAFSVLFDGTLASTVNWRGYRQDSFPTHGWRVEDGELIVEYRGNNRHVYGTNLITRERYRNFDLRLEFMLSDTANSGIFYLGQEVTNSIADSAPEYQLLDDSTYLATFDLQPDQLTGANYDLHACTQEVYAPARQWNRARIVKAGSAIRHYLNDTLVVAYTLGDPEWRERYDNSKFKDMPEYGITDEGHIGLQDHGRKVSFRNIRIRRL